MKIALCQTTVHKDWHKNLRNAERVIAEAVKAKADIVSWVVTIAQYHSNAVGPRWTGFLPRSSKRKTQLIMVKPDSLSAFNYSFPNGK